MSDEVICLDDSPVPLPRTLREEVVIIEERENKSAPCPPLPFTDDSLIDEAKKDDEEVSRLIQKIFDSDADDNFEEIVEKQRRSPCRPSTSRTLSAGNSSPLEKKKKRPRKNSEATGEKEQKNVERMRKKVEMENEKERKKIERELSASLKSKREQYTFCHVGSGVLKEYDVLEHELRQLFSLRKIAEQLTTEEDNSNRIIWWRKHVEAERDADGGVRKVEFMTAQPVCLFVPESSLLSALLKGHLLDDVIREQQSAASHPKCRAILVHRGNLGIPDSQVFLLSAQLWERHHAQLLRVDSQQELAMLIAQMHRAIANREGRRLKTSLDVEKANSHAPDFAAECWQKMLASIVDIGVVARRAIVARFPNPLEASEWANKVGPEEAEKEIAALKQDGTRTLGSRIAHKIVQILTDPNGEATLL